MKSKFIYFSLLLATPLFALAEDSTKQMCTFISDQSIEVANIRDNGETKENLDKKIPTEDSQFYVLMRKIIEDAFIKYKDQSPKMVGLDVYHSCMQRNNR